MPTDCGFPDHIRPYLVVGGATGAALLARRLLRFTCLGSMYELPPIHERILFRKRPAGGVAGRSERPRSAAFGGFKRAHWACDGLTALRRRRRAGETGGRTASGIAIAASGRRRADRAVADGGRGHAPAHPRPHDPFNRLLPFFP